MRRDKSNLIFEYHHNMSKLKTSFDKELNEIRTV